MKSFLRITWSASAILAGLTSALPAPSSHDSELRTVHQFPSASWIENMAICKNGQILATDTSKGQIYLIDPKNPQDEAPVVAQFPNNTALTGITEVEDDVFYTVGVLGKVYTFTFNPNTTSVWEVDMRDYAKTEKAAVRKVTNIPPAIVPNGMTPLSKEHGTILISDSAAGVVYKVNIKTGDYEIVFDDPLLKPIPTAKPAFGANGIHIAENTLYFTNTNHGYLGTIPISLDTGKPTGPAKLLADDVHDADDFTVDSCGNIWLAKNVANTLVRVFPDGHVQTIAGGENSTALAGPVATAFGRGCDDSHVLYISTDGLAKDPATGKQLTNGKIAALDTKNL